MGRDIRSSRLRSSGMSVLVAQIDGKSATKFVDGEGESGGKRGATYSLCVTHFDSVADAEATLLMLCRVLRSSYLCLMRYPGGQEGL